MLLLLTSCAARQVENTAAPLMYHDQVISRDTVWDTEVIIEGVVMVSRKATLTIKPGTTVRFKRIDTNNDTIGDSEIRVLGRLLAEGTINNPIIFESAEKEPRPKDWSYVLIFTSGKKSRIKFCQFSHAFSGVQVHFSSAAITNSFFINNHEGLRFGRARLKVTGNVFKNNDVGIRFTRMEGPVTITQNLITENRLGIFLVPSGQNIQDFFEPDRSGQPWNTGRLLVTSNNIYDNYWYNLSLGEKQLWDLDVTGNWWGTTDAEVIRYSIFDKNRDPQLGKALFIPYADKPVNE
jgi:plastocyanin